MTFVCLWSGWRLTSTVFGLDMDGWPFSQVNIGAAGKDKFHHTVLSASGAGAANSPVTGLGFRGVTTAAKHSTALACGPPFLGCNHKRNGDPIDGCQIGTKCPILHAR
jgi:hypothetical protein